MENLIYAAVVLGNLCDENAGHVGIITKVLLALSEIDRKLIEFCSDEDKSGIDHTVETEEALAEVGKLSDKLTSFGLNVEVYFNDEVPQGEKSRLRIECPGTCWGADSPLYLS